MYLNSEEKRKKEMEKLKEILSRFPQETLEEKISVLPKIDPIFNELEKAGFVQVNRHPGFGDPVYGKGAIPGPPNPEQINEYGLGIYIEPARATTWQWELIKRALGRIGFAYVGQGQKDWFLILRP